jgi:Ca-activated chloride channel family protein
MQYSVLLILLHVSLAQPFYFGTKLPIPPNERDIVFVVDTSVSMLLRDYLVEDRRTERMSMLKSVLQQFIRELHGSRLALVAFSEQPYTFVPLTQDYSVLQTQLQRLEPAVLTGRRSDVSLALLYCAEQFSHTATEPPVLVLITDATRPNRAIDPRAAARYLADRHFHLHVVGIGAASYAAREQTQQGLIYHPINFRLLEEIAGAGNGQFFWAKDSAQLQQALRVIQNVEQRPVTIAAQYISLPLYPWPLALLVLWLCAWQILPLLGRAR